MESVNQILVPYLILMVLSLSVLNHASNFKGSSQVFLMMLNIVSLISIIGILAILITIGIKEKWYVPMVLAIGGLIIGGLLESFILKSLGSNNQFILSLLGLLGIPIALFIILNKILF